MKIQATWIMNLPLKFTMGNQFKELKLNDEYYQIFNGEAFTTVYGFESIPPIMVSSSNESIWYRVN